MPVVKTAFAFLLIWATSRINAKNCPWIDRIALK